MLAKSPYNAYANTAINTASKEALTLMLYEGALKFTNQAIISLEEQNYARLTQLVKRSMDIIRELQITLDRKYEISNNMYLLYDHINDCLSAAGVDRDPTRLIEARDLIREFKDTWSEAMKIAKKK